MTESEVKQIVKETIIELKKQGFLKDDESLKYAEAASMIKRYYTEGETDISIRTALKTISSDPYSKLIPLAYDYGYSNLQLAEVFGVDVTTVKRNKKRLCLQILSAVD